MKYRFCCCLIIFFLLCLQIHADGDFASDGDNDDNDDDDSTLHKITCTDKNNNACYGSDTVITHGGRPNDDLLLECKGEDVCKDITLKCPPNADCLVTCKGKVACGGDFKINCGNKEKLCAILDIGITDKDWEGSQKNIKFNNIPQCDDVEVIDDSQNNYLWSFNNNGVVKEIQYCKGQSRSTGVNSMFIPYCPSTCDKCFVPASSPSNFKCFDEPNSNQYRESNCNNFYDNKLHVWCEAITSCKDVNVNNPSNHGNTGTCSSTLSPGGTCQPNCNKGYEPSGATKCNDKTELIRTTCNECSPGSYKVGVNANLCQPWSTTECSPGFELKGGSTTEDKSCYKCENGKYKKGQNSNSCQSWDTIACDPGYELINGNTTHDRTCIECENGKYKKGRNSNSCQPHTTSCSNPAQYNLVPGTKTKDAICIKKEKEICNAIFQKKNNKCWNCQYNVNQKSWGASFPPNGNFAWCNVVKTVRKTCNECCSRPVPPKPVYPNIVVSELRIPFDYSFNILTSETCRDALELVSCTSNNTDEVTVDYVKFDGHVHKNISRFILQISGVMDYVNLDGNQFASIECMTNYGSSHSYLVENQDILFPFYEFEILTTGTDCNFLFAGRRFQINALGKMEGPTFFNNNITRIYISGKLISNGTFLLNENGRSISFIVPTEGICSKLDCEVRLHIENNFHTFISSSSVQSAHYTKSSCHNNPKCKEIPDDYRDYPSNNCPYGHAGQCKPCPLGARCPGGDRIWALPGFASIMDFETNMQVIEPCPTPAERCLGYQEKANGEKCAIGYSGSRCGGCVSGYYHEPVGPRECYPCPQTNDSAYEAIMYPVIIVFGALLFVFFLTTLISYGMHRCIGEKISFGESRARAQEFMIYLCVSLALLSQVSRASLGRLPTYMNDLAGFLAIFQFDVAGPLSPQCIESPFWREKVVFYVSIFFIMFQTISLVKKVRSICCKCCSISILNKFRHGGALLLCISYTLVCNFVVKILHCVPVMHMEGNTTVGKTYVLASNSLVECYKGIHMHTFMIGVVSGILHIILFPIISCIVIIYVRHKYVSNWYSKEENAFDNRPMWKYFLKNSYLPHYFYFRQLELGVIFIAAICNEIFAENDIHIYLVLYIFLALFCSISYVYAKPFVQDEMWKLPIRLFTFFCTFIYALTQYLSSNLAIQDNKTLAHDIIPIMSYITMVLCCFVFFLLPIVYFRNLLKNSTRKSYTKEKIRSSSVLKVEEKKKMDMEMISIDNPMQGHRKKNNEDGSHFEVWHEQLDVTSGKKYYHKKGENRSTWTEPKGVNIQVTNIEEKRKKKKKKKKKMGMSNVEVWHEQLDVTSGKKYYHKKGGNRSTWTEPKGVNIRIKR